MFNFLFGFLNFGDFDNSLSVQLLGEGDIIAGIGDILFNLLWLLISCLHILTVFHCDVL